MSKTASDKPGAKVDELHLTPLELIARSAALATPAQPAKQVVVQVEPSNMSEGASGVVPLGHASAPTPAPAPPKRSPAHYLWAVLIARVLRPCGTDSSYAQRTSSVLN